MKTIIFLIFAGFFLLACSKEHPIQSIKKTEALTLDFYSTNIIGKWQLYYSSGGFSGGKEYSLDDGNYYFFDNNDTCKRYKNDTLSSSFKYSIKKDVNDYIRDSTWMIFFENSQDLVREGDSLVIKYNLGDAIEFFGLDTMSIEFNSISHSKYIRMK